MRTGSRAAPFVGYVALVAGIAAIGRGDAQQQVMSTSQGTLNLESLARLEFPWAMAALPDGRFLITEKPGRLRVYSRGTLSQPIGGVPRVEYLEQGGLLDVAVDPDFANNQLVYLYFTERAERQPPNATLVPDPRLGPFVNKEDNVLKGGAVVRGRLEGDALRDARVIWRQEPKTIGMGHFGGRLVFGPDGKLFIASGDRQRFEPAQDMGSNLGKIVRINPDGSIPDDNPFVREQGARQDIWTVGHRNPLGAAIHPASNQLWVHEMGPAHGDELNLIERGKNYGWPIVSNGDHYDGTTIPKHATRPEFAPPVLHWYPAISPSGLHFYNGRMFDGWTGNALIGGLSAQALIRVAFDGNRVASVEHICLGHRIRDVAEDAEGGVLLLTDAMDGELLRMTLAARASASQGTC